MAITRYLHGVFPIYKPAGYRSSTILDRIRSRLAVDKVTHSGALCKYAEGIMILGVGHSESVIRDIEQNKKRMYLIRGLLGLSTTTFDATGDYTQHATYNNVTESRMREALKELFLGTISLPTPPVPAFRFLHRDRAAVKTDTHIEYSILKTEIIDAEVIDFDPPSFQLHVYTRGRFYPQSLVHEMGLILESTAHLTHLCRVQQGVFGFRQALHYNQWDRENIYNNLYLPKSHFEV